MGWLIFLALAAALAALPLGVQARYEEGRGRVSVSVGPLKWTVYPRPRKPDQDGGALPESEPVASSQSPPPPRPPHPPQEEHQAAPERLLDYLPLVRTGLDFLGELRWKLRAEVMLLHITLAGGDPCDLAVAYGRVCAAVGSMTPLLDRAFIIRKRDIQINCDFAGERSQVRAQLELTVTLGRALLLAVRYGVRALRQFLSIQKSRKGGAVT